LRTPSAQSRACATTLFAIRAFPRVQCDAVVHSSFAPGSMLLRATHVLAPCGCTLSRLRLRSLSRVGLARASGARCLPGVRNGRRRPRTTRPRARRRRCPAREAATAARPKCAWHAGARTLRGNPAPDTSGDADSGITPAPTHFNGRPNGDPNRAARNQAVRWGLARAGSVGAQVVRGRGRAVRCRDARTETPHQQSQR